MYWIDSKTSSPALYDSKSLLQFFASLRNLAWQKEALSPQQRAAQEQMPPSAHRPVLGGEQTA